MTHTIGPKSFLFGTAQFSFGPDGAVNYDYNVTNTIKSLLIDSQDVFPMAHTLTIVEPIRPRLQNLSKTLMYMHWTSSVCYTVQNLISKD